MKTVPSAVHPPKVPLATSGQNVEAANGSTRLSLRATMPGTMPEPGPAVIQEPTELRGHVLDRDA